MSAAKNSRLAIKLCGVIAGMLALTAAAVPLYDLVCRATGWAGTPRIASTDEKVAPVNERIEVLFNADVSPDLPWSFEPVERRQTVQVGSHAIGFYEARNTSDKPIVGTAVFNVTPLKVGNYFVKVDCFCFEQQRLDPGETVQMPVSYYVDPAIKDDVSAALVKQITLSYTFFIDEDATEAISSQTARLSEKDQNAIQ